MILDEKENSAHKNYGQDNSRDFTDQDDYIKKDDFDANDQ